MIEQIGENEVYVRDYTSNFKIKEYIQDVLLPKYFPGIPVNKLNLGLSGMVGELIGQGVEDAYTTASLMMNEAFITKAILPRSIYANGAKFGLGGTFAKPSRCKFALQLSLDDVVKYSEQVPNTNTFRYCLDKDTKIFLDDDNPYTLDYDIFIDHQIINGERVFTVYYHADEENSISTQTVSYLNYRVTSINWLVIFVTLQQFSRKYVDFTIASEQLSPNRTLKMMWSGQIAGFDIFYTTPSGKKTQMIKKIAETNAEFIPFAWYKFIADNTIQLSFSTNPAYFIPEFNSTIEGIIYTCNGSEGNFTSYNNKNGIAVSKSSEKYEYNASTKMVALCYSASVGGQDRGDVEQLREDIITAYQTANAITTENDLKRWLKRNVVMNNIYASEFLKKRDDPSGRLYSQFVALKNSENELFPTNTLNIQVSSDEFDQINSDNGVNSEFIIEAGHLWEYIDENSVSTIKMIKNSEGKPALISDSSQPSSTNHVFVNPFFIKIIKEPSYIQQYNCLLNHTSFPEEINLNNNIFFQFQLTTLSIERTLSSGKSKYKIQCICVPAVEDETTYISSLDNALADNDLRLVMIFKSKKYGETGYLEMKPVEFRKNNSILFETEFSLKSQLQSDDTLEIDLENSPGSISLISEGEHTGKIFIDSSETNLNFITLVNSNTVHDVLFNNPQYQFYEITNKFTNTYRDLNFFEPLGMMRSVINFEGENDNYTVTISSIPVIKQSLALDETQMLYFISAFNSHYETISPIQNLFDGDMFLDIKLFNSYGRSTNYYIGPPDDSDNLYDSTTKLSSVYVKVKFKMAVYDRSIYSITEANVRNEVKKFFNQLNQNSVKALHISNLIRRLENNISNIKYIRFLGFNEYDARKQSIFVKDENNSSLNYVPEILCIDTNGIEISEEI